MNQIHLLLFLLSLNIVSCAQKHPEKTNTTPTSKEHKHTNALIDQSSPYLLQHAHNPVNWYPWGEEALEKAKKEAERQRIEAEGKANANRILSASLTDKILKEKGIEATLELAKSPNSKVVVIGGSDGMPLILGDN